MTIVTLIQKVQEEARVINLVGVVPWGIELTVTVQIVRKLYLLQRVLGLGANCYKTKSLKALQIQNQNLQTRSLTQSHKYHLRLFLPKLHRKNCQMSLLTPLKPKSQHQGLVL